MQAQQALAGSNGGGKDRESADRIADILREQQGLPEQPHKGGLAVVRKDEPKTITLSANMLAVVGTIIVQTVAIVWWARGIDSQVQQQAKDNTELRMKLDMHEAEIYTLTTKFAEFKGANEFARYLEAVNADEKTLKPKKETK